MHIFHMWSRWSEPFPVEITEYPITHEERSGRNDPEARGGQPYSHIITYSPDPVKSIRMYTRRICSMCNLVEQRLLGLPESGQK